MTTKMNNKTAIDWFVDQIENNPFVIDNWNEVLKKAKSIEKEQIVDAFIEGNQSDWNNEIGNGGQQYYNETFNQIKNDDEQSN